MVVVVVVVVVEVFITSIFFPFFNLVRFTYQGFCLFFFFLLKVVGHWLFSKVHNDVVVVVAIVVEEAVGV